MPRSALARVAVVLLVGGTTLGTACLAPTQFRVALTTDLDCARLETVELYTGPRGGVDRTAPRAVISRAECTGPDLGNIVVAPSGARDARVQIEVVLHTKPGVVCVPDAAGKLPDSCLVARRALAFIPHTPLELPIQLDAACLGVRCDDVAGAPQTCLSGKCVPAELTDPARCSDLRQCPTGSPAVDGGTLPDGGPVGDAAPVDGAAPDGGPQAPATSLSVGANHACVVVTGGTVKCWGLGSFSQLGPGAVGNQPTPVVVTPLPPAIGVAAGAQHSCALLGDGSVQCWGSNGFNQLASTGGASPAPTAVPLPGPASQLAAGWYHNCVQLQSGGLRCWGANAYGQLGDNSTTNRAVPVSPVGLMASIALSGGADHTCLAAATGAAYCWGRNHLGQLGDGSMMQRLVPGIVNSLFSPTRIAAGARHTCAIVTGGDAYCWGDNTAGQLGTGGGTSPLPVKVNGVALAVAVAAADSHTCALLQGGSMKCWGNNMSGQLGTGDLASSPVPTPVIGLARPASAIGVGIGHTCALLDTGAVQCWGDNQSGQIGDGTVGGIRTAPKSVVGIP
jgi:alpha-tubulin suppressor-like RCC1 family protein